MQALEVGLGIGTRVTVKVTAAPTAAGDHAPGRRGAPSPLLPSLFLAVTHSRPVMEGQHPPPKSLGPRAHDDDSNRGQQDHCHWLSKLWLSLGGWKGVTHPQHAEACRREGRG